MNTPYEAGRRKKKKKTLEKVLNKVYLLYCFVGPPPCSWVWPKFGLKSRAQWYIVHVYVQYMYFYIGRRDELMSPYMRFHSPRVWFTIVNVHVQK